MYVCVGGGDVLGSRVCVYMCVYIYEDFLNPALRLYKDR